MTRQRRRATKRVQPSSLNLLDELLEPMPETDLHFGTKELKLELKQLKLEQKLNKQIRRLIDYQLKQLDIKTDTKPDFIKEPD